mmetsp:Transcript_149123/g.263380  ORF Transcript_149123/g.263380 Transcript_149123/m.263380 type:complete len:104 (+) Transcript_149123:128-439(+)
MTADSLLRRTSRGMNISSPGDVRTALRALALAGTVKLGLLLVRLIDVDGADIGRGVCCGSCSEVDKMLLAESEGNTESCGLWNGSPVAYEPDLVDHPSLSPDP